MNRFSRYVLVAGAVSVAASLAAPQPAHAAPAGKPVPCLRQPAAGVDVAVPAGQRFRTPALTVAAGSPCRDVNVRQVVDVDGKATCRTLRVVYSNGTTTSWRRTCKGWVVVASRATEGRTYSIELKAGRPAVVQVRS